MVEAMIKKAKPWYNQKTTRVGIAAILGAVGGYLTGDIQMGAAIQIVITALIGIFLRDAVN